MFNGKILTAWKNCPYQIRIPINKALHLREKLSDFVTGHRNSPNRTVAFNGHQYSLFVGAFAAFVFNSLLITGFATNVFFIQLNHTAERRNDLSTGVHHLAHRMASFQALLAKTTEEMPLLEWII
jgi:hypothetical protein